MSYLWYWPAGGWDFEKWKAAHPWKPVRGPQSDNPGLVPLASTWEQRKGEWGEITRAILGDLGVEPPRQVRPRFSGPEWDGGEFTMKKVAYPLTEHELGYAWLLLPKGKIRRRAAVIALHQTAPQGKNEPAGLEVSAGRDDLEYATELARRDMIVLVPDAVGFGERQAGHANAHYRSADQFFAAHPNGSVMGKMAYDTSRAVDLLQSMPEVDPDQIGVIGHSHGGYGALFAMLADQRIKAGVISCGINPLRHDPTPQRWWRMTALIPRLGFYEGDITQTPIDFHVWLAMLAPRAVTVVNALEDEVFPNTKSLSDSIELARQVYELHDQRDRLHYVAQPGGHRFTRPARERAYRMFEEQLA